MPEQNRNVINDEQLKKMMSANKVNFFKANQWRIVTFALMAINIIVFLIEAVVSGFSFSIPGQVLVDMGAMYVPYTRNLGDLYRFVTPMFLHMDVMHLAFNMLALYSVGGVLERVLGKGNFILLYFIAGITGNTASYIADIYFNSMYGISAGASTSVFGLFVAVALLGLLHKDNRQYFAQYSMGMLSIIALNVVYTFAVPGISISGHLGGALGGLIAMFIVPSKNLRVNNAVRIIVGNAWVAAFVFMLAYKSFFIL